MLPTPYERTTTATAGLETDPAATAETEVATLLLTTLAAVLAATSLSDDALPVLGVLIWVVALLARVAADVSRSAHHVNLHSHPCGGHRQRWRTHHHPREPR